MAYGPVNISKDNNELSASDILTKLKTIDGSGSGLDADLFKGNSTISIANGGTGATDAQGAFNNLGQRAFMGENTDVNSPNQAECYNSNGWRQTGGAKDLPTNSYGIFENKQAGGYIKQIYACTNKHGDYGLYIRLGEQSNIAENEWQRVYTSRNAASLIQNLLKGGSISVVKSVQRGTVDLDRQNSNTTLVSISSINTNKSLLIVNAHNTSNDTGASSTLTSYNVSGKIYSSTQLQLYATSYENSKYSFNIDWQVIEFY